MKIFFVYSEVEDIEFPISLQVDDNNTLHFGPKHGSTSIWRMWNAAPVDGNDFTVKDYVTEETTGHWVWRPTDEALESAHNEILRKFLNKKLGLRGEKEMPLVDRFKNVHDYLSWSWGLNDNQPNDYHCMMEYRLTMLKKFKPGDHVVNIKDLTLWLQRHVGKSRHEYSNKEYNFPIAPELSFDYYKTHIIKKHTNWYAQHLAVDILVEKYYENQ